MERSVLSQLQLEKFGMLSISWKSGNCKPRLTVNTIGKIDVTIWVTKGSLIETIEDDSFSNFSKGVKINFFCFLDKKTKTKKRNLWNTSMYYLKVIKFRGYLISRFEKNYIFRVFNFEISAKIRNESLIEYQFFYC